MGNLSLHFYKKKFLEKEKAFNTILPVSPYVAPFIKNKEVYIAELGSGPFSIIGSLLDGCIVHVVASDILADEYNELFIQHGIKQATPIEKQNMEELTYQDNFFDIVFCENALDHMHDPMKALKEMHRICKLKGVILLRHFENCAKRQRYRGEHEWNIALNPNGDKDCILWSRDDSFLLSSILPGVITEKIKYSRKQRVISSVYTKI